MTKRLQVYKCDVCGNMVEVIHDGPGQLVCCNQPMTLQEENTVDAAQEKHVPVIEKTAEGIVVKVGSVEHPMQDAHFTAGCQGPDDAPKARSSSSRGVMIASR